MFLTPVDSNVETYLFISCYSSRSTNGDLTLISLRRGSWSGVHWARHKGGSL